MITIDAFQRAIRTEQRRTQRSPSQGGRAPSPLTRLHRTAGVVSIVIMILFGMFLFKIVGITWLALDEDTVLFIRVCLIVVVGLLPFVLLLILTRRAVRIHHLRRAVCIECGYDLRGAARSAVAGDEAADGVCPECGRAFEHASMRTYWYPEACWGATVWSVGKSCRTVFRRRDRRSPHGPVGAARS